MHHSRSVPELLGAFWNTVPILMITVHIW
jgi:hypothetical protein